MIRWSDLVRWNTVPEPEVDGYLLLVEQIGLSPRRVFIPERETLEDVEAEFCSRQDRDESLVCHSTPVGYTEIKHVSALLVYSSSLVWGIALAFLMSYLFMDRGFQIKSLLYFVLVANYFLGLPGGVFICLWRKKYGSGLRLWFRVGFGINLISSVVAMLFVGLFSVWFFLLKIL